MHGRFRREASGWSEQPRVTFVERRVERRRAWVQIKRNIEALERAPERAIFRQIVVQYAVRLARLRIAVDQCAFESEIFDAALELLRCELRLFFQHRGAP